MIWWIPAAMAAAGYLIDKKQGGSGFKGAAMGGAMGMGFGAAGAGAGAGAASSGAASGAGAGTALGSGGYAATSNAYLGGGGAGLLNLGGGYTSGSVGGMTGFSPAAKAALPNAMPLAVKGSYSPALTTPGNQGISGNGLTNLFTQGTDYISEGISDMTFADQLGVGMQAEGLLNRPTRRDQYTDIQPLNRKQFNQGNNILETQIQDGIPIAPEPKITEEELRRLLDSQY